MTPKTNMGSLLNEDTAPAKAIPPDELPSVDNIPQVAVSAPSAAKVTKIPDLRGKRIAMKERLYASLGLSPKYTPRLTRKTTAIYQLVNNGGRVDNRITDPRDRFVDPPVYDMVPHYVMTDTDEVDLMKREKTMTFYDGGTDTVYVDGPIKGKPVPMAIPKIGAPIFINGQIVVNIYNEYPKYAWLELHPRNASNKWRNQSAAPIFERVDTKYESPHIANIKLDLQRDAESYLLLLKPDKLINLASSLANPTVNTNIGTQDLLLTLRMRARLNPEEILYTKPDNKGAIKIAVIHALDYGVLLYVPEHESYYLSDDEKPVFQVPVGNNPFDMLVEFLAGPEGSEYYKIIQSELSFWF